MDVKRRPELEAIMKDFYEGDSTVSQNARDELITYGRDLIRAGQLEDYQDLMNVCANVIADRGIDVTPVRRDMQGNRPVEKSDVPAPIALMRKFEEQARTELGELTEGAVTITQTREIVEKLATVLSRQREIIEKIQKNPASVEKFVAAIDKNNELSQKQIGIEQDRLKHFREYFPDTDSLSTINPNGDTYKLSQYDKVHRADMQVQLLEDLKTTINELNMVETERAAFQAALTDPINPDPDAQRNIEACERKAKTLKEKITKVGEDGRETGILQRLRDFGLESKYFTKIDIDRVESYADKGTRVDEILKDVKKDRAEVYSEMAKTVLETLDAKGVVDQNSTKYPPSRLAELRAKVANIANSSSKKDGPDFDDGEELSEEELESARLAVKNYVKYVKDDIQKTQDRIEEFEDAIEFRNEAKEEVEKQREAVRKSQEEADRLRRTPVTDDERDEWLNDTVTVGEGDSERSVVAKDEIERVSNAKAQRQYANKGKFAFTRFFRDVGFFFRHGFKTRNRMISEKAESLIEQNTNQYIRDRRKDQIDQIVEEGDVANRKLAQIEKISKDARNDASVHSAAHNAAANITDENILSGENNRNVKRAENSTAQDLSNMGYDIALQKWRNGDMTQADFDRILKEHLENPDRRDRYAKPDETKGYTRTPEYRNSSESPEPEPEPEPEPSREDR